MAGFSHESLILVRPFAHTREGDEVTIGDLEREVFLAIPAEGLDVLNWLAAGNTVGETVRRYEEKYGETPDVDEFLDALAQEGFVAPRVASARAAPDQSSVRSSGAASTSTVDTQVRVELPDGSAERAGRLPRGVSLDWISPAVARRLCSVPVLVASAGIVGLGLTLVASDPAILPGHEALLFYNGHFAAMTMATVAVVVVSVLVHELAHAVAARAAGVPVRLVLGNLMYFVAAQTVVSGVWLIPKRQRYLVLVAGLVVDAVTASLLVGLVWADRHNLISMSPTVVGPLVVAVLFTYLMRMFLQFFFAYLRTDIYYIVATTLRCKNLMADTEQFLRNRVAWLLRRRSWMVDQSALSERERWAVRFYSLAWLAGRGFAFSALFLFYLPLLWAYVSELVRMVVGESRLGTLDFLTLAALVVIFTGGGLVMWLRELFGPARQRRAPARSAIGGPA